MLLPTAGSKLFALPVLLMFVQCFTCWEQSLEPRQVCRLLETPSSHFQGNRGCFRQSVFSTQAQRARAICHLASGIWHLASGIQSFGTLVFWDRQLASVPETTFKPESDYTAECIPVESSVTSSRRLSGDVHVACGC